MKSNSILTFTSVLLLAAIGCLADQTNAVQPSKQQPSQIKTNFVKGAELNSVEINQVLTLARQSGIEDAAEVETFHYMPPAGGRGIRVKSKERVDGRNISYDTVTLSKNGWGAKPDKSLEPFKVRDPKYTTHLRTYEINKKIIRITIGEGITTTFADKALPAIISKKVRFENNAAKDDFNRLGDFTPRGIYKSDTEKLGYELFLSVPAMYILRFRLDNGEVAITGVSFYVN
jgi:hypothetical protein